MATFAGPYPYSASGVVCLPISLPKTSVGSLLAQANLGRPVAAGLAGQEHPAGAFEAELSAARLAPGLSTYRLTVAGQPLTRQLSSE